MWNPTTRRDVQTVACQPLQTIDQAVDLLSNMSEALRGLTAPNGQNPVLAFNELYFQVTQDVQQHIFTGTYRDPAFMKILDVEFARLYCEALRSWTNGQIVPVAWAKLFALDHDGDRHTNFEGALLGVNAHVNRDLTCALVNAKPRANVPKGWEDHRHDFDQINAIFCDRLDPIVNALIDSLPNKPSKILWRLVDNVCGRLGDRLMMEVIIKSRSRAWKRANHFWSTAGSEDTPEYSGRSNLSAFLAKVVLRSHVFDGEIFSPWSNDDAPALVSAVRHHRVESALSHAGEILFGSDMLEMDTYGDSVAVTSRSQQVYGAWARNQSDLASMFSAEWVPAAVEAETPGDIEINQLKQGVAVLRQQQGLLVPEHA